MTRDEAKSIAKNRLREYLQGIGIDTGKAFKCLNPQHEDHHPSMRFYVDAKSGPRCHCLSCGVNYDIFDVVGIMHGLTGEADKFNKTYEILGLDVDGTKPAGSGAARREARPEPQEKADGPMKKEETAPPDFSEEVAAAHARLMKGGAPLDYLHGRGLSDEIISRYRIGYDPGGYNHFLEKHPEYIGKRKKAGLYQLFFPYMDNEGKARYFLSEIADRAAVDDYNGKYIKIKGLPARLFNERYITAKEPPAVVFITEGIYDALSIEEAGGHAIALTGTGHNRLITLCGKYRPPVCFVLALDHDGPGQKAQAKIREELDRLEIPCMRRDKTVNEGAKDENEELIKSPAAFRENIKNIIAAAESALQAKETEEKEAYLQTAAAWRMADFWKAIEESKKAPCFPTGFRTVDRLLDGGLYPGLYVVGAISSLGKTTFCLQVCDNIAAAGHDVLIFSLEMASSELIAKSISRLTLIEDYRETHSTARAKTTRGILAGARYDKYSPGELEIINRAIMRYQEYSDHIYIREGVGNIGVGDIRKAVGDHVRLTGEKPVILVDYLQILAPYNDRATDKQNTDKAVTELKRISRDFSIPVICISSFNRDNYTAPVNMASFKESGAVEYSSDVLIGLQYEGMEYREGEGRDKRAERIRGLMQNAARSGKTATGQRIEIKILKNRNGAKGNGILGFIPMFNYFSDEGSGQEEKAEEWDET